ncbi:hypothetical protein ACSMX9_22750 [Streptomyces sp. LE64]|uniref:hypothetical protein n=1 Tax=Streptomyces sp. LE64 TaxID=3448653 RepID=UPI0040411F4D
MHDDQPTLQLPTAVAPVRTAPSAADQKATLRAGVIARQLDAIVPGTRGITLAPVVLDDGTGRPRRGWWVYLIGAEGAPISASAEEFTAAGRFIKRFRPDADWTRPTTYDARTGTLRPAAAVDLPDEVAA